MLGLSGSRGTEGPIKRNGDRRDLVCAPRAKPRPESDSDCGEAEGRRVPSATRRRVEGPEIGRNRRGARNYFARGGGGRRAARGHEEEVTWIRGPTIAPASFCWLPGLLPRFRFCTFGGSLSSRVDGGRAVACSPAEKGSNVVRFAVALGLAAVERCRVRGRCCAPNLKYCRSTKVGVRTPPSTPVSCVQVSRQTLRLCRCFKRSSESGQ